MNRYTSIASLICVIIVILVIVVVVIYVLFIKKTPPTDKPPPKASGAEDKPKPLTYLVNFIKSKYAGEYEQITNKKDIVLELDRLIKEHLSGANKLTPKKDLDEELAAIEASEAEFEQKYRQNAGAEIAKRIEAGEISPENEEFEE
jgi:hypothetical protein